MQGFAFCNELYGDTRIEDALSSIAAVGYTGVELDARCLAGRGLAALRDECAQQGLVVVGLHWLLAGTKGLHLTHPEQGVRDVTVSFLETLVDKCAELGGEVMTLGAGQTRSILPGVTRDQALGYAKASLVRLGERLVARGIRLGVEPLRPQECNLLNEARVAAELVDQVGCPNIGLTLDAKAMASESRSRDELIRAYSSYLVHIHVNDPSGTGPGLGAADLAPMVTALREIDYQGWISVEAFDPTPDPDTVARGSFAYITGIWDRL